MIDEILNQLSTKQSHSIDGLIKFQSLLKNNSLILDIGAGKKQLHSNYLKLFDHRVETCDLNKGATYREDFNSCNFNKEYDAIWSAHCLEHQLNPNIFLKKINSLLKNNGILCITVPPLKQNIVSGHVSLWNAGILLYHLVLAEFNCRNAMIKKYGYNISIIIKKEKIILPNNLKFDKPDLITLKEFFPDNLNWDDFNNRGFDGDIEIYNWN